MGERRDNPKPCLDFVQIIFEPWVRPFFDSGRKGKDSIGRDKNRQSKSSRTTCGFSARRLNLPDKLSNTKSNILNEPKIYLDSLDPFGRLLFSNLRPAVSGFGLFQNCRFPSPVHPRGSGCGKKNGPRAGLWSLCHRRCGTVYR